LIIPCEVAVKSVIPAVKALMANELVGKHGLKQNQVAELLGMSQSAVSKYTKKVRGYVIRIDNIEEVQVPISSMVTLVTNGTYRRTDFFRLFCQVCIVVRKKGLMCPFCQKTDQKIRIEGCAICLTDLPHEDER
jgi:predicted transcriptional regulator